MWDSYNGPTFPSTHDLGMQGEKHQLKNFTLILSKIEQK